MTVLAIDPGNVKSAWLMYDGEKPVLFEIEKNTEIIDRLTGGPEFLKLIEHRVRHLAIETLHVRGMPTAQEEMETQFWAGRFVQAAGMPFTQIKRMDVKMHICGSARARDAHIRQALIDRYGGRERAIGTKKKPGPLHGISHDLWSALAIAITYHETHK